MTEKNTDTPEEIDAQAEAAEVVEETAAETPEVEETPLEKAEKEAAEMKSRWLRSVADMENYKCRRIPAPCIR